MTRGQGSGVRDQGNSSSGHAAKRMARLAAVQALYQNNFEQESLKEIIRGTIESKFAGMGGEDEGATRLPQPDQELFAAIVQGVEANRATLDEMIKGALDSKKPLERLEILLQTILRAGIFELYHHASIPAGVIINDYVDVTRAFYNVKEPGLVNGILDRVGKNLRKC